MATNTTIQISSNVKTILDRMKLFERETYNEIIERMVEDDLELNEKTKKAVKKRSLIPDIANLGIALS